MEPLAKNHPRTCDACFLVCSSSASQSLLTVASLWCRLSLMWLWQSSGPGLRDSIVMPPFSCLVAMFLTALMRKSCILVVHAVLCLAAAVLSSVAMTSMAAASQLCRPAHLTPYCWATFPAPLTLMSVVLPSYNMCICTLEDPY